MSKSKKVLTPEERAAKRLEEMKRRIARGGRTYPRIKTPKPPKKYDPWRDG